MSLGKAQKAALTVVLRGSQDQYANSSVRKRVVVSHRNKHELTARQTKELFS